MNVDEVSIDPAAGKQRRGEEPRPEAKPAEHPGASDRRRALRRRR